MVDTWLIRRGYVEAGLLGGGQAAASTIGKLVDGVSTSSSFDGLGGSVSTASMKGWGKRSI